MLNNYLKILEESLMKKIKILDSVQELCDRQSAMLGESPLDMEGFDLCVDEKDVLITELSRLDEGFEALYDNIKQSLQNNRFQYAQQIQKLQGLIQQVMDKSMSIQAQESRNRDAVTAYFKQERQNVAQGRRTSKAMYDYYKNISNVNAMQPQFMDQKK